VKLCLLAISICLLAACSSTDSAESGSSSTSSVSTTSTTQAPSTTEAVVEDTIEDNDETGSLSSEEPMTEDAISSIAASIGVTYDEDLKTCLASKGIETDGPLPEAENAFIAVATCSPEEAAKAASEDVPPPEGVTTEDFECVVNETFSNLGDLPLDEAANVLGQVETLKAQVGPTAQSKCGLSEEQVNAIIDAE